MNDFDANYSKCLRSSHNSQFILPLKKCYRMVQHKMGDEMCVHRINIDYTHDLILQYISPYSPSHLNPIQAAMCVLSQHLLMLQLMNEYERMFPEIFHQPFFNFLFKFFCIHLSASGLQHVCEIKPRINWKLCHIYIVHGFPCF